MECTLRGCPGSYEHRTITHAVRREDKIIVIDHVPAEVCNVCGDTLLTPETSEKLDEILADYEQRQPADSAPVYEFA